MHIIVAVFGDPVWTLPVEEVERLRAMFPAHTFTDARSVEALAAAMPGADVAFSGRIDADLLALAPRLCWVQSPAAGVGRLLSPLMRASEVILTNARGIHADPIAEHVLGVTLALARHLHEAVRCQIESRWAKLSMSSFVTLRGRRMGIVGFGAIGSAVAARAAALGMRVSALRRTAAPVGVPGVDRAYGPAGLDDLVAESDVVVVAAPLTAATHGLIGRRELRLMKPGAFLVNIARGKLVREAELADELARGTIAAAALDVFEHEPLDPASPLWRLPNVIITPHTSGFFPEYWRLAVDVFADNLRRFEAGAPLVNVVDKAAGY